MKTISVSKVFHLFVERACRKGDEVKEYKTFLHSSKRGTHKDAPLVLLPWWHRSTGHLQYQIYKLFTWFSKAWPCEMSDCACESLNGWLLNSAPSSSDII